MLQGIPSILNLRSVWTDYSSVLWMVNNMAFKSDGHRHIIFEIYKHGTRHINIEREQRAKIFSFPFKDVLCILNRATQYEV